MSFKISVTPEGFEEALKKVDDIALLDEPMRELFRHAGQRVTLETRARTPVHTGALRRSIRYTVSRSKPPLWMRVKAGKYYGLFQEYGTGRMGSGLKHGGGHFPPPTALENWARSHGFPSGVMVARAIAKRGGLRPKQFWRAGVAASLGAIQSWVNDMIRKIESRWGS
jgi:hypothetical protein